MSHTEIKVYVDRKGFRIAAPCGAKGKTSRSFNFTLRCLNERTALRICFIFSPLTELWLVTIVQLSFSQLVRVS